MRVSLVVPGDGAQTTVNGRNLEYAGTGNLSFSPALRPRLTRRYHSGIGNGVVESLKTYVVCAVSQPASEEREKGDESIEERRRLT